MIIFDYNHLLIHSIIEQIVPDSPDENESLVRHITLNALRRYIVKFKREYGPEIVIACDSRHYWRADKYQYYKAHRKNMRDNSKINWDEIFKHLNRMKKELILYSPYKIVEVNKCEGDDIIAVLSRKYSPFQRVIIISPDKDFGQLQQYPNISQYSPMTKGMLKIKNPHAHLKELIIRGDKGDGVPNILSPDDIFVTGGRQKSIFEKKLEVWMNQRPDEFCTEEMLRNFNRNKDLIDLSLIPEEMVKNILDTYNSTDVNSMQKFMNYMIEYRLSLLIECLNEF